MMGKIMLNTLLVGCLLFPIPGFAAEKLRVGSAFKGGPNYDVLFWAAEEKGLWRDQGLEIEWYPFRGGALMFQAAAGGKLDVGVGDLMGLIQSVSKGVRVVVVADLPAPTRFHVWVRPNGPIREPGQLKGGRIGVEKLAGTAYAYAQFAVKSVGLNDKEVRFVGLGGLRERLGGLEAEVIDAFIVADQSVEPFKERVRSVMSLSEHLPQPWMYNEVFAHRDIREKDPAKLKSALKAIFASVDFIRANRTWVAQKLVANYGYSSASARTIAQDLYPGADRGRIEPKALENVVNFLIEYNLLDKQNAPPLNKLYVLNLLD